MMYGPGQLHSALHRRLYRIREVLIVCEHASKVDEGELAGEGLPGNHVVDHRQRERAHATAKRVGKARVIDGADSRRELAPLHGIQHPSIAFSESILNARKP